MSAQDLEQFHEAVSADDVAVLRRLKDALPTVGLNGWHKGVAALDRLLSIIDNAGKVECAEPVAWITPESIRHLAKMNGPANVVVWNCATSDARVPLYTAPHQPAPVVDDALADTQRAIIEAAERRGYERAKVEAVVVDDAMRDLIEKRDTLLNALKRALPHVEHAYHTHEDLDGSFWIDVVGCRSALARAQGVQS